MIKILAIMILIYYSMGGIILSLQYYPNHHNMWLIGDCIIIGFAITTLITNRK